MRARGDRDDASGDARQQQIREREVAQVVGAELQLKAIGGAAQRRNHDPGVVDQQVDLTIPARGKRPDRGEAGEVEFAYLGLAGDARGRRVTLLEVAHGQRHLRARRRQDPRCRPADTAVRAGNDHAPVRNIRNVCSRKARHTNILS
jgi:hypothetical protein